MRATDALRQARRLLLIAGAMMVALFPFYWMLRTALAPRDEVFFNGISLLPTRVTGDNFVRAWTAADLGHAMLTGTLVTGAIVLAQLLTCIPAAYAFARLRFPGSTRLYGLVLASLLIPIQATAVPTYVGLSRFDLANRPVSLVLPFLTSAFGIFVIRQYVVTLPEALFEAARMDGLSHLQILLRLVIPLAMPAILTFALFSVFVHWNDYLWPLLVARSPALRTPPLALAAFQDAEFGTDYGALAAGAAVITVPIVLLFTLARRRFVAGFGGGEVVG